MKSTLSFFFALLIFQLSFAQTLDTVDPVLNKLLNKKFKIENLKDDKSADFDIDSVKGKPTLINIWFTTCEPCIKELPFLNDLQKKLSSKVNFIALTFDSKEKVEKFLLKYNFDFKHINTSFKDLNKIGINKYPLTFILDNNGYTQRIFGGIHEYSINKIENILQNLY